MKPFVITTALLASAVSLPSGAQNAARTSAAIPPVTPQTSSPATPQVSLQPEAPVESLLSTAGRSAAVRAASSKARSLPDADPAILSNVMSIARAGGLTSFDDAESSHALGTCACSGAPAEGEPAGCGIPVDNFNGGCNSGPPVYSAITLGGSVCGTGAFDGSLRDTDWYRFTLTTTTTVQWTVRAEFPVQVALLDNLCPPVTVYANLIGPACADVVASATIPAGTYVAFVAPSGGPVTACGASDNYRANLIGVTACGYDDGVSEGSVGLGGLGGGEQLYLHRQGGTGQFSQVNSISMAWGSAAVPGFGPPIGSNAQIRLFKDPDDDGIPDDLILLKTKAFTTSSVDTDIPQTVAFDAPVNVSGFYFIGVSIVSLPGDYPVGLDQSTSSDNRAWFTAETNGSGGVLDYVNFFNNDYFFENSTGGLGVFLLRANCQPLEGGCRHDDAVSETTAGYNFVGEKLFVHRYGAVGEAAEVRSVSMSWGSPAIPGFSIPNGTPAQVRIFEDPNDDGILDDAVLLQTQGFLTQDVDTDIFHSTVFAPPVVVRGVYFVGVSLFDSNGDFPLGFDMTTDSANRAWFVGNNGGVINYGNLPAHTHYGEVNVSYSLDGVHMLRADCHPVDEITPFCAPGVGGIVTCPCGNPQVPAGSTKGCNNFAGGGTGGAILSGSGVPTISGDTLAMNVTAGVGSSVTVLFQGTTNTPNTRTGAGVRCVGGTLKRLYKGNQAAGAIAFPNVANNFHIQSAVKGFVINPPITLYYYAAYRNSAANGQPGCPGLTFGFNSTNALAVVWTP